MLLDLVFEAENYTPVLDQADAANFVDWFVEAVITVLRKRPETSKQLSSDGWRLIFADLRERARAELAELIDGAAFLRDLEREIANVLSEWGMP